MRPGHCRERRPHQGFPTAGFQGPDVLLQPSVVCADVEQVGARRCDAGRAVVGCRFCSDSGCGQDGGVQVGVAVDEAAMHSGSARDRTAGPKAGSRARQLLQPAKPGKPWPDEISSQRWGGKDSKKPLTKVEPLTVAEVTADAALQAGQWRHPLRFVRIRAGLQPDDVPTLPGTGGGCVMRSRRRARFWS